MHTWLPPSLLGRGIASVRRLLSRNTAAKVVLIAILVAIAAPLVLGQGQTQPPTQATPQPGTMVQEHANPPGNAPRHAAGGEAGLVLPDMSSASFFDGKIDGFKLLSVGIAFCFLGGLFGLVIFMQLKNLPVHRSMREISELIYETCKTYLTTQGKFILLLWVFIAVIVVAYFGVLRPVPGHPVALTVPMILLFSLVGIAGSYGVAWFGIRVNTFANSRTAFASLAGKPYPIHAIPLKAGMSIGMLLISVELLIML